MTFKKSWYSYGLWAFYVIFAFVFQISAVFTIMEYVPNLNEYVKIGVACLSFALTTGLFFLIRKLIEERWKDTTENGMKRERVAEAVAVIFVFVAGIVLRILFLKNTGDEAAYFTWASVDGQPLMSVSHGAQQLYLGLLRGLFLFTGNKYMSGIILQIILQILMTLVWYLAVRKMAGQIASFVVATGIMLLPQSIHMGLVYSPKILYLLLFGFVLLLMSGLWNRFNTQSELQWYSWLHTIVLGCAMGYMIYLDITGMVLIVLVLFTLAIQSHPVEEPYTNIQKLLQILLVLLACVASLIGSFFVETLLKGGTLVSATDNWFNLFVCKGMPSLDGFGGMLSIDLSNSITALAAAAILFMAALAFWVHKSKEMQMPWFAVAIVLGILYACNFCAASMQCDYMFVLMILLMAGVGIRAIFIEKENKVAVILPATESKESTSVATPVAMPAPTPVTVSQTTAVNSSVEPAAQVPEKKINYIENPLPLPKKHIKRTMGYRLDVPEEAMKYDIEVSDNDDFDLK